MRQNDFRHLKYTSIIDLLLWCHKCLWRQVPEEVVLAHEQALVKSGSARAFLRPRESTRLWGMKAGKRCAQQLVCKRCSIISARPPTNPSPTRLQSSRVRRNTLRMKACSQAKVVYVAFWWCFRENWVQTKRASKVLVVSLYIQWNESSDTRTCTPSRTLLKPAIGENRNRPTGHTWRFWPIATIAENRQVCRWLLTDKLVPISSLHKQK